MRNTHKDNYYTFYKDELGDWYINLPNYPGNVEDLQMVAGADLMLDIYAQGDDTITLQIIDDESHIAKIDESTRKPFDVLELVDISDVSGAYYKTKHLNTIDLSDDLLIWLCDVTLHVFGKFPKYLYIKG